MSFITVVLLSSSILLPLAAGFLVNNKSDFLRKFLLFLSIGFLFEIILFITSFIGNNLLYFNIYTLIEIGVLGMVYVELIENTVIKSLIGIVAVFLILEGILGLKLNVVDSTVKFYESIFIILCSITYFLTSLKSNKINLGNAILNSGLLLFFSTTIIIFLVSQSLIFSDKEKYEYLYAIHSYINFGVNFVYLFGMLAIKYNETSFQEKWKGNSLGRVIL